MSTNTSQTTTTASTEAVAEAVGSLALRGSHIPLKPTGVLDKFKSFDVTPFIGREYPDVQLVDLLRARNSDELLRELAIIVSQRGVVFFRSQEITIEEQKLLANKLGVLSGRPDASGLHVHPANRSPELPPDVSPISSERGANFQKHRKAASRFASQGWHSDITFEPVPSDFAILKIHTLPGPLGVGGDTLWASAYEAYDRLTPALASFLDGLTAVHEANQFHKFAEATGQKAFTGVRGHPANDGPDFQSVHPVIRTNPVTGWKGLFVNPGFTKSINGLSKDESDVLLGYLFKLYTQNHDLQVRFRWNKNDVAIWNNTSTVHSATFDYDELRVGDRVVSLGEKPYLDPSSQSRRAELGLPLFH
ncbi:hypothetical protein BCR35DRAFT_339357 [Leucosporidium creatinivorum]|uniref:TauD/TfdA-like domain-containing protein n=1 Tax=Leucosporidium creatinivorum TaxID=106004 RepID=A0A1Y2BWX0_9BASI|nr:hypothetical protein BCR35DRAFT_339357 [Leucosporidium creatinivorum]